MSDTYTDRPAACCASPHQDGVRPARPDSGGIGAANVVLRWFSTPGDEWARPIVATVLVVLLLGIPHHRLFIWLSDSVLVKYWKEIAFAGACLAYGSVLVRRRGLSRTERRGVLWAAPFVIAVLVRLLLGVLGNEDRHLLIVGGGSHLYYVPIFLLGIYLLETSRRSPSRQVERMLYWVLIATSLAAVLSVLDNLLHFSGHFDFFGRTRVEARLDYDQSVWRSSATYQSPMHLGMIAGTGFLLSLHLFLTRLQERPRRWRSLAAFVGLMTLHFAGMYLTFSRGPLVATAGGATIIGLFGDKGLDWRSITADWRKAATRFAGAVVALALVILLLPSELQRHLGSIFDWSGDQNNVTRLRKMVIGLERFQEAPWIGSGLGTAQMRLWSYRFREIDGDYFFSNPESQLLSWAMEGGLLLLVPALLIVGFMIHTAFAMASSPDRPDLRRIGVLFLGIQAALYAEGLIMPILDNRTFQLGFWVLFGVLAYFRGELNTAKADAGMVKEVGPAVPRSAETAS